MHRRASRSDSAWLALGGAPSSSPPLLSAAALEALLGAELVALDADAVVLGLELELELPGGPADAPRFNTRRISLSDATCGTTRPMCDLKQEVEPLQAVPRSAVDDGVATAATVDKCAMIGTFIACVTLFSLFGLSVGVV